MRKTLLALLLILATAADLGAQPDKKSPTPAGGWKAGVASIDITPEYSMWMAGYGARTKPADGKLQTLFAKAIALEDSKGHKLVLITTDLVGMRGRFTDGIAADIAKKHGLKRSQLMFTSSHTHCGPLLAESLDSSVWYPVTPADSEKVVRYTNTLRSQLIGVIERALADLRPAVLATGMGNATFAVNRREPTPKGVINGKNPTGPVDHEVPVLRIESPEGKLRAVAFGYACHNTTLAFYLWCGDYAGFAQEYLEKANPGVTALFFMGCGGDANPLPRSTVELCKKYGQELADAVTKVLKADMTPLAGPASSVFATVDLGLDKFPTRDELTEQAKGTPSYRTRRANMLLKYLDKHDKFKADYPYPVQVWKLGPSLTWIALGGESVVDYAHKLKKELGPGAWIASYANDVMAYIPSLHVLKEGGYEATITSGELAGSQWAPDVEDKILAKVRSLVESLK